MHDCIRKLDPCLHMFRAFQEVPQSRILDTVFLSTALEDFTLHSDDLSIFHVTSSIWHLSLMTFFFFFPFSGNLSFGRRYNHSRGKIPQSLLAGNARITRMQLSSALLQRCSRWVSRQTSANYLLIGFSMEDVCPLFLHILFSANDICLHMTVK